MQKITLSSIENFCIANVDNIANAQCEQAISIVRQQKHLDRQASYPFNIFGMNLRCWQYVPDQPAWQLHRRSCPLQGLL